VCSSSVAGSRFGWALAACAFFGIASFADSVAARPGKIDLTWNAPIGCPDRESVLHAIVELMGDAGQASDVSVRADVGRVGAHLVLKLVLKTAASSSERTMEASDCEELARGAALVVALAAGAEPPSQAINEPKPNDAPAADAAPPAPATQVAATSPPQLDELERDRAGQRSADRSFRAAALFGLDAGSFPHPALGAAIAARYELSRFSAGIETLFLLPQDASTSAGGGRFWGAALALRPCLRWSFSKLTFVPCVVADLEMMVAEGRGVTFREQGIVWFPRFGAGAHLGYAVTRKLSVVTAAWVLAAPARPTFVVDGTVPIHSPGFFSGRWETGLEFAL
jgi:hypothetical protein